MKHLTTDYNLRCETVRKLVKSTWENYQLALAIARESGLLDNENDKIHEFVNMENVKLSVFSYDQLLEILKSHFKVDITRPTRHREIVDARHISYYILRRYTSLSLIQVAELICARDHTTVIHGINKIRNLLQTGDSLIISHVKTLCETIETKFALAA